MRIGKAPLAPGAPPDFRKGKNEGWGEFWPVYDDEDALVAMFLDRFAAIRWKKRMERAGTVMAARARPPVGQPPQELP